MSIAAAFAASGAFHFLTGGANILDGTRMPHLLEGFSDPDSVNLADFRDVTPYKPEFLSGGNDLGITTIGGVEYGFWIRKNTLEEIRVYQMVGGQALSAKKFAAILSPADSSVDFKGGWGSIWVYQGTVYAANNNGG